jgi:prolyl-tRNA editing enzyme YbaK/EbsC (Cys-tRNA(Pro) deacylase)
MTAGTQLEAPARLRGFAAVRRGLDEHRVTYEVVLHEPTGSTRTDSRPYDASQSRAVKAVAVRAGGGLVAVAVPASGGVNMFRVGQMLGDRGARLATEDELDREFPDLDDGALSPFGAPGPALTLVDRRVLFYNWVLANGGDHRHSIRVSLLEIVRISHARVVDIAEGR